MSTRIAMMALEAIRASEQAYAAIPYTETGDNVQRFSDTVNAAGLAGCQGQPWCATYQFAVELETVGKEQALSNWCMSEQTYCGYSVFSTEAAFLRKGRTGQTPRPGALVIFKHSHMGRVLSVEGDTFLCGEGNTSNAAYDRNGDACAVKRYKATDARIKAFCYIDYKDIEMDAKTLIKAVRDVYKMAHDGRYKYGDSHAMPPCSDGLISCDRLVARALYNLGYVNQPAGGITVINGMGFLVKWGFGKITSIYDLKAGDIVIFSDGTQSPNAKWHWFVLTAYDGPNTVSKYDCGAQWRIDAQQPFVNVPLNEWGGNIKFYCAFRIPSGADSWTEDDYTFDPTFYRINCPDVVKSGFGGSDEGLKRHYDTFGKNEGRAANCVLVPSAYKKKYKDLRMAFGSDWAAYIHHFAVYGVKEGRIGSVVFSPSYYRGKYKDLERAFGNDRAAYFRHFLTYGMKEGRQGSKDFDPRAYRKRYKDLDKAFGDDWPMYYIHYLVFGQKEKRKGT